MIRRIGDKTVRLFPYGMGLLIHPTKNLTIVHYEVEFFS